ncbi:MAG: cytochrome c oxidase subunit 3 [Melioribacteraceae bacterium]|nr:cytochrome c oxidase subunit 3 [Melioribacteraceae bacterium]
MSQINQLVSESDIKKEDNTLRKKILLFFISELLLFGGWFVVYAIYKNQFATEFNYYSLKLNTTLGTLNTVILISSGLLVSLSLTSLKKENKFLSEILIVLAETFALMFLVNLFFEWGVKISAGLYPTSEILAAKGSGEVLFYYLYFIMTGIMALHLILGIIVLANILIQIFKDKILSSDPNKLDDANMYWNFTVLIWLFVFPLFYLIQ